MNDSVANQKHTISMTIKIIFQSKFPRLVFDPFPYWIRYKMNRSIKQFNILNSYEVSAQNYFEV